MAAIQGNGQDKPAILIRVAARRQNDPALAEVQWGIEEEGVPQITETVAHDQESAVSLAYEAAGRSRLGVGLALDQEGELVLHYFRMPQDRPLFLVLVSGEEMVKARALGNNAARLVKGIPFKALEEDEEDLDSLRAQWEERQQRRQHSLAEVYPVTLAEESKGQRTEGQAEDEWEATVRQVVSRVLESLQRER